VSTALLDEAGAKALAEQRWPGFAIWTRKTLNPRAPFQVGIVVYDGKGATRRLMGCGLTWERAFLSADRREQNPHGRGARPTRRKQRAQPLPQLDMLDMLDMLDNTLAHGRADAALHRE